MWPITLSSWLGSDTASVLANAIWDWLAGRLLGPLCAGLILAAFGSWWISRLNEQYKGRRDHASKSVDALRAQLESVVSLSSGYWLKRQSGGESAKTEAEIAYKLDDISSLVQVCASELWSGNGEEGPRLVAELMASIVTPEYATATRAADPTRPMHIAAAAMRLSQRLTVTRHDYFANPRPRRQN